MKKWLSIIAALGWMGATAHAQSLGIYTFTDADGNEATLPVDVQPANATFSDMSRGTGVSPSPAGGAFSANGWTTGALDADDYFQFSITPDSGFAVSLTELNFKERRSGTGPRDISVRSSLDGFSADIDTFNVPDDTSTRDQTVTLGAGFANQSAAVTFRLYGYNAEGGTGTWRIDDVELFGTVGASGPVDPVTNVQFTAAAGSVGEGDGTFEITVYKTVDTGNVSGQVLLGGTATQGDDFTINTTSFTLNGAVTSATFVVTVIDDLDVEGDETLTLTLNNVVGAGVGFPSLFTLTILDNDVPPSPPAPEGTIVIYDFTDDSLNATVVQSNLSASAFSANDSRTISFFAGTPSPAASATGWDVDDRWFEFAITVDPGSELSVTNITFDERASGTGPTSWFLRSSLDGFAADLAGGVVDPNSAFDFQDQVVDIDSATGTITFRLYGAGASGPAGTWRVDNLTLYGEVIGDSIPADPVTNVQFTASAGSVGEGDGTFEITVYKTVDTGNVSGDVLLGGTATQGDDYTINTTSFALNGAVTSATFVVTVIDDGDVEGDETLTLTLANVIGGAIGSPSVFTLTIVDNDEPPAPPAPEGTLALYEFNDNSLDPTAVQSNLTASVFSVNAGRTITFPAGEPSPAASANGWNEADRWFEFTLTVASGFELSVTNITFDERASATGPTQWFLRSSLDSYTADLAGGAVQTNSTFELQDQVVDIEAATGVVTFRLYGAGAGNPSGTWRVDNVTLYGVVVPDGGGPIEPEPVDLADIMFSGGVALVTFTTEDNIEYTLEYTLDPTADPVAWEIADIIVGDGGEGTLSDTTPVDPSRIYRIMAE